MTPEQYAAKQRADAKPPNRAARKKAERKAAKAKRTPDGWLLRSTDKSRRRWATRELRARARNDAVGTATGRIEAAKKIAKGRADKRSRSRWAAFSRALRLAKRSDQARGIYRLGTGDRRSS